MAGVASAIDFSVDLQGCGVRIFILGLNFHPELTGAGKYTAELASWLSRRGHEVQVICAPPYYPGWALRDGYRNCWAFEAWQQGGVAIKVRRCPLWVPARPSGWKRVLHLMSFAASSMPVLFGQLRWKPDVLVAVAPTLACAPAAIAFSKLARCPTWLHVQDFELDAAFGTGQLKQNLVARFGRAVERALLRGFDRVSTISDKMLERLRAKLGRSERTVLLTNWVDPEQLRPLESEAPYRREFGCAKDDILVLYSGSIGEKQGLDTLLEAAAALAGKSRYRFVICGEGPGKEALAARYAHLRNVTWKPLQPAERLAELLGAADVHALPQRAGIADLVMPSKLLGMMASGKPVVAMAAPDTEIWNVMQGRGLVVPPEDSRALADAIKQLGADAALGSRLGAAARAFVEENLERDKVLSAFEAELVALVDGRL